jgi:hypothetical protein
MIFAAGGEGVLWVTFDYRGKAKCLRISNSFQIYFAGCFVEKFSFEIALGPYIVTQRGITVKMLWPDHLLKIICSRSFPSISMAPGCMLYISSVKLCSRRLNSLTYRSRRTVYGLYGPTADICHKTRWSWMGSRWRQQEAQ